jgi:hypothetical protein
MINSLSKERLENEVLEKKKKDLNRCNVRRFSSSVVRSRCNSSKRR